jgi:hypothetical protein
VARTAKARKRPGLLYRQAQLRGLLGGSRPWMILWVVLAGRRLLRRLTTDAPEIVYSEELADGQTIVVSAGEREPRVLGG